MARRTPHDDALPPLFVTFFVALVMAVLWGLLSLGISLGPLP